MLAEKIPIIKLYCMEINKKDFPLIVADKEILGGKPCIKGTRISVDLILEWIASGASISDISNTYKLDQNSITQAILFAAERMKNEIYFEFKKSA
ncbi:MAG: DUF433 domain-containing protein [Leptospiraceae bacterium]|nr:DUF433 domain-containing protein [Leptospiraceae bacterium]